MLSVPRDQPMAALPTTDVIEAVPDYPGFAFEARVLPTLSWFGLMERREVDPDDRFGPLEYRKAPLYDPVLSFDVPVRAQPGPMF